MVWQDFSVVQPQPDQDQDPQEEGGQEGQEEQDQEEGQEEDQECRSGGPLSQEDDRDLVDGLNDDDDETLNNYQEDLGKGAEAGRTQSQSQEDQDTDKDEQRDTEEIEDEESAPGPEQTRDAVGQESTTSSRSQPATSKSDPNLGWDGDRPPGAFRWPPPGAGTRINQRWAIK